jgi:hypothetical protein
MSKTGVVYTDVNKSDDSRLEDDHIMKKLPAKNDSDNGCYLKILEPMCS